VLVLVVSDLVFYILYYIAALAYIHTNSETLLYVRVLFSTLFSILSVFSLLLYGTEMA